jgi:UDP-3-O-[3-hydroxymyristoyl] glucosamine N-acyltransferase
MKQNSKAIPLREIAALLGCAPVGGAAAPAQSRIIEGVATLRDAGPADISFLSSEAFLKEFQSTRAAAVLIQKNIKLDAPPSGSEAESAPVVLIVDDADLAMGKLLEHFALPVARPEPGIDAMARVDSTAQIGPEVSVGPFACIGRRAKIGRGCVIHAQVFIGDDVTLGESCEIFPNVTIRERITLGARVIINAGSVLGTDGFGYRWDGQKQAKIPQIGTIIVEDDVEIGSCVCIDRAKFSATRIGKGTKIDNLVQVAHNVSIGSHCLIAGQAGMAGSAILGSMVMVGGQVAVRDHISVGDRAMLAARSAVADDVPPRTVVSGTPALPHRQNLREQAALRRLPDLVVQVRKIQEQLEQNTGK